MKFDVIHYDYKYKIYLTKSFLYPRTLFVRKVKKLMNNFPNYSMYWSEGQLIVNLYFDNTGWDKDRENTNTIIEFNGDLVNIKWVSD